jgi:antitoxin component YwqK of YwqJK toxin-antitoxin module
MNKIFLSLTCVIGISFAGKGVVFDTITMKPELVVACTVWTPESNIYKTYTLKNGKFHGLYLSYYKTGKLKETTKYNDGNIIDTTFSYYQNGKLKFRGVRNGIDVVLSENGDTLGITNKCSGSPCGNSKSWYKGGILQSILNFNSQGKKHGLCESWREDGTRKDSTVYRNDTIIEEREYFTSGKVRQWFKKCLDARFVEAYFYHPDGTSAGKIVKGNGIVTGYTETADRKFIDRYENGSLVESKEIKN